jgi:ribosomal-protein-alanine N-acetyltransferase
VKAPLIYIGGTLKTARLTLEPLRPDHAETMFDGFSDPRMYTWIDVPPPARIATPYAPTGELWLNWPMRVNDAGAYAGLIEATMRPDRVVYLAYFVFTRFSRKGLAKEACAVVIEHLFRAYDAVEIRADMDYRNIPSRCLIESLGFRRRRHNKQTTLRGRPALDYRYRLKRPER